MTRDEQAGALFEWWAAHRKETLWCAIVDDFPNFMEKCAEIGFPVSAGAFAEPVGRSTVTGEQCQSVFVYVANEDIRCCELTAGHEGKHREVTEWTDEEAEEAASRWT